MGDVKRIYVEKKAPYAVKSGELMEDLKSYLGITSVSEVRVLIRYDVEGLKEDTFKKACSYVVSEPPVDILYENELSLDADQKMFSVEYLPGQYDQRADSAEQCVRFLDEEASPVIKTAVTYVIKGNVSDDELARIRDYVINPVDSRIADNKIPDTLVTEYDEPDDVKIFGNSERL